MRTFFVLAAVAALAPLAAARVWTTVYRYDEVTRLAPVDANHPTVYRDIMVGTRLVLVVTSDRGAEGDTAWTGSLLLSWDDANDAALGGRGYEPGIPGPVGNYRGSCLDAAGTNASAEDYAGPEGIGLTFHDDIFPYVRGGHPAVAGDWFIFDYRAEQVGQCSVGLYDLFVGFDTPLETLSFTHTASRDFNADRIVNFEDFALLAGYWRSPAAPEAGRAGAACDLSADGRIGVGDLALFTEYWLERTDRDEPAGDPNDAPAVP